MQEQIIASLSTDYNFTREQVRKVLNLLEDGNTIPFIARYRKEATGGLNEIAIKEIKDRYDYQVNLLKRKEDVIRLIAEKEMLSPSLKEKIMACQKLVEVEDIYLPFKEKKETKASLAKSKGLEGLAKIILSFPNKTPLELATTYKCQESDPLKKLEGAKDIIKEYISLNAYYRKYLRSFIAKTGVLTTKFKKNSEDPLKTYEMYYDYAEKLISLKAHRLLAINRGEKEKILTVNITIDEDRALEFLNSKTIKNSDSPVTSFVKEAVKDAFKKSIFPSIEKEIRSKMTEDADKIAIKNFQDNVANLLLTPPLGGKNVLGFDPAFRTGCKLAALDQCGNVLEIAVIYPHEPKCEKEKSKKIVLDLINKYHLDVVAIGNGTASRESESFIASLLKEAKYPCQYLMVSEAGASVYSASSVAIKEFPSLDVSFRSAISIGRRVQDPLAELVKIDPKSIGVGLYQHDLKEKDLDEALNFTVTNIVNQVGVNINTASFSLLSYLSGINKKAIEGITLYKEKFGRILSREEFKKIKGITPKIYEQAVGFIRIYDGDNPLDKTNIHPDNYEDTYKILKYLNCSLADLGKDKIKEAIMKTDLASLQQSSKLDKYTLEDILKSLAKPILDPRDEIPKPILKSDILTIADLKKGMELRGTVRNVIDFGVFVDIGLKNDALIHISELTDHYIKHPSEVLKVGDIINCYVLDVKEEKIQVSLTRLKEHTL